jgi:hypothetical protein
MVLNIPAGDLTDVLVVMALLSITGLALTVVPSIRAWRMQMASLFALSAVWVSLISRALTTDDYGPTCRAHHKGEWPLLILTIAWAFVLLAATFIPTPPFQNRAARVGVSLASIAVLPGTIAYVFHVQQSC